MKIRLYIRGFLYKIMEVLDHRDTWFIPIEGDIGTTIENTEMRFTRTAYKYNKFICDDKEALKAFINNS